MKYTFNEAIEELENIQGSAGYATKGEPEALRFSGLDVNGLLNEATQVIEKLREEYAPTVEMTKQEFEIFSKAKVDEDSAEWLDNVAWDRVDYKYPDFFMAWLHPETIKVVDE